MVEFTEKGSLSSEPVTPSPPLQKPHGLLSQHISDDDDVVVVDVKPESKDVNDAASTDATKSDGKDEKPGSIRDYFRIFRYTRPLDWLLYGIAFTCEIGSGAALPLMTLIFGSSVSAFDRFAVGGAGVNDFMQTVDRLALYFVYLAIARFVVVYVAFLCIDVAAIRTTRTLRSAFLEHTLRQEVWHFDNLSNGSTATQVTTNGNRIYQGIAEKLGIFVQGFALFISSFIVALSVQWKLALIVMSIVPAIFLLSGVCISFLAAAESKVTKIHSSAAVIAQDAISSIKTIHAFSAQEKIVKRYDEKLEEAMVIGRTESPWIGAIFGVQTFIVSSGTALAFWQGYRMFRSGEIDSVGTVMTIVLSVTLGATSMMMIAPQIQAIANAASAASELFSILDKPSLLDPLDPSGLQPSSCVGEITIEDLSFSYPSRPTSQVLRNLRLHAPAGKTTAIVGASGSGKSTLVGLLERWYEQSSGRILLDGVDLRELNTKWLRTQVRLVQQEPTLFSGTVYQNVVKGLTGAQLDLTDVEKMSLVRDACTKANAHEFVQELPEQYHTQIGERASMLSGGQKQRLAIARSIISDPRILLLDEATSALDPRAEKVVQDALNRVSASRTTIVIAHKLATIKKADSIAVMSKGEIIEQGTHEELIARGGQYAAMVLAQDLGAAADSDEGSNDEELPLDALHSNLEQTQTGPMSAAVEAELRHLTSESVGYSLLRSMFIMFREHKDMYLHFFLAGISALLAGGIYPAQAIIFSRLINVFTIQGPGGQTTANFWALMFFVLALVGLFASFGIGFISSDMAQVVVRRYRKEMMDRIIHFDQDFFDRPENASGSLTSKLSSMPTALQEMISANSVLLLMAVVNVVGSSLLGIAYGWKLGLVLTCGGMPILVASGYYRIHLEQKLEENAGQRFAQSAGLATEAVSSIRTVSSLTMEDEILKEYAEQMQGIVGASIKGLSVTLVPYALSQSLQFCIQALGFWYGSRLMASGEYSTTQFFVVFIAIIFGGQAAGECFGFTTSITKAQVAANYILWLRTIDPAIKETPENEHRGPSDGALEIENLEFRYKQRDSARVLRGIDLKIEPGVYVGVVGGSGSGKSTLVSLLERFYDPNSGRIMLAGEDIKTMSPHLYRAQWSLVEQMPPIYQTSVGDNIALGLDYEPSEEELREACRQANALEFISSLPEGLSTPCGSKGMQFSGGQRQRIAVARALIRKPKMLILDEATSALDTQSERIVQKALDEAATNRTTIAVAHRLSTIRHADVICVLGDGKVVEMGTHEELQALKGRYYAMCLAQSLDQDHSA